MDMTKTINVVVNFTLTLTIVIINIIMVQVCLVLVVIHVTPLINELINLYATSMQLLIIPSTSLASAV